MSLANRQSSLTETEYLQGELNSNTKHEFIDGEIYAMAGASANHERISGNVYSEIRGHLKNNPCEPFGSDMKVKVGSRYFYPDVIVDCDFDENTPYFSETPILIVEVLSDSTRKTDETTKRLSYLNIESLQEYVLIEQDFVSIKISRRTDEWRTSHYYWGDDVTFESVGLTLSVEALYHRVNNEDVAEFIKKKAQ